MKTKLLFLQIVILLLWVAACTDNSKADVENEEVHTEEPTRVIPFPDAVIVKELPKINLPVKKPIETAQIIRTREELLNFYDAEALATNPDLNSINFSEQTLLLNGASTYSDITGLAYTYTKTGDSTYSYATEVSGVPVLYAPLVTYAYGVIVKKLPPTAEVTFVFDELVTVDEEETKKLFQICPSF